MPRRLLIPAAALLLAWLGLTFFRQLEPAPRERTGGAAGADTGGAMSADSTESTESTGSTTSAESRDTRLTSEDPLPGEALLIDFGDPGLAPIEDLKRIHRVVSGYFSIVKDTSRHPIGGNGDLADVLRGDNAYQEAFIPADHPVFGPEGLLVDRWGTPLFVHSLAARELELRSAGPDGRMFTADDLRLDPAGLPGGPE